MSVQSSFGTSESPPGLHSEHRSPFPLLQGAAQGWRCHVLGPPRCSGDGDGQSQPQPCSTGPIEWLRGGTSAQHGCVPPRQLSRGSWAAPALRTVSSWSGVSSDSQITSWLWVVQGAPQLGGCPGGLSPWRGCVPHFKFRICRTHEGAAGFLRAPKQRAAPPASPSPCRAHKPRRNRFGPCGQSGPPTARREGRWGAHVLRAATDGGLGASWIPAPHKPGPGARGCSTGDARPYQEARLGLGGCLRGAAAGPPGALVLQLGTRGGDPMPAGTAALGELAQHRAPQP